MGFSSDKIFKRDIFFGQIVDPSEKGGNPYSSFTVFCDRIDRIVGDRIFVCQRFLQVRDAQVCHIQDIDTGFGCDPVGILATLLDVANLYIWDDCFRFPAVPVVKLESCPVCSDQYSPVRHEAKLGEADRISFFLFCQYGDTDELVCLRFVKKQVVASGEDRFVLFVHRDVYQAYLLSFWIEMRTTFARKGITGNPVVAHQPQIPFFIFPDLLKIFRGVVTV